MKPKAVSAHYSSRLFELRRFYNSAKKFLLNMSNSKKICNFGVEIQNCINTDMECAGKEKALARFS